MGFSSPSFSPSKGLYGTVDSLDPAFTTFSLEPSDVPSGPESKGSPESFFFTDEIKSLA